MPYVITQPPFTLKFHEMSKVELESYFKWFLSVIPERVDQLEMVVKNTPGFEKWRADLTTDSLFQLGEWFKSQVETRKRTENERQEIEKSFSYPIEVPGVDLTNRTFSLAMDIGFYFSQVLLARNPSLQWKQTLDQKKFVDYGQPVLVEFGSVPLNPIRISISLAYGLVNGKQGGERLKELYDFWVQKIT